MTVTRTRLQQTGKQLAKSVSIGLLTYLVVLFLVFSMILLAGGSPVRPSNRVWQGGPHTIAFHKPALAELPSAFAHWGARALQGDLGRSLISRQPVTRMIRDRMFHTLWLNLYAMVIMMLAGISMGALLTRSRPDISSPLEWLLYALYATPDFVLGILLLVIFGFELHWFPSHGIDTTHGAIGFFRSTTLPAVSLAASGVVFLARFTRTTLTDVLHAPFVFARYSRGLPASRTLLRVFRNGLIPFATLLGFVLPALLGGSVVIESLFSYPGIGKTFYDAILTRDFPVVLALTALNTAFVFIGLATSRALVYLLDPRKRHEMGH